MRKNRNLRNLFSATGETALYCFDLPARLCLKTPAQPVILSKPVLPAKAGIVSTHRSVSRDSRRRGNDGMSENEHKQFALKKTGKKRKFSNQTGMRNLFSATRGKTSLYWLCLNFPNQKERKRHELSNQTGIIPEKIGAFLLFLALIPAEGKLHVVTTTTNLRSLTQSIGGDQVRVESLTQGPQDPHYLPAKPSLTLKVRTADLLILNGLDLETGWLPHIVFGSRNPRVQEGRPGYLDVSGFIQALSVPKGKVDRFFGDIHPFGNPHFLLDPVRAVQVSKGIRQKLSELDPKNRAVYMKNQKALERHLMRKLREWEKRIRASGVKSIVSRHSSFDYFLKRFQLRLTGLIEEKPGIPPSAKHILALIQKMKETGVSCVLVSGFYSGQWAEKIKETLPVHTEITAIEATALKEAKNYTLVIEGVVKAVENCGKFAETQRGKG